MTLVSHLSPTFCASGVPPSNIGNRSTLYSQRLIYSWLTCFWRVYVSACARPPHSAVFAPLNTAPTYSLPSHQLFACERSQTRKQIYCLRYLFWTPLLLVLCLFNCLSFTRLTCQSFTDSWTALWDFCFPNTDGRLSIFFLVITKPSQSNSSSHTSCSSTTTMEKPLHDW